METNSTQMCEAFRALELQAGRCWQLIEHLPRREALLPIARAWGPDGEMRCADRETLLRWWLDWLQDCSSQLPRQLDAQDCSISERHREELLIRG